MRFEISFSGHKNIRSLHQKTIEITKDVHLTPRGDCIVGVNASCGCSDLPDTLKAKIRNPGARITCTINVCHHTFSVQGRGDASLVLTHPTDIVVRKSSFTCPRTLAIKCDRASDGIPRQMIKLLQNPETRASLVIEVD